MKLKTIAIVGPTASGKSSLGIILAKKLNGEIISADSRQVYKGLDIGSGKVSRKEQKQVPHHLIDIISPTKQFSVNQFKKLAQKKITEIMKRGKIPIIVGGTAFYVYALLDNWELPEAKPNLKLRKELSAKTISQLFSILKKLDPNRAKQIDPNNPHRLIRAIEIIKQTGKPIPALTRNTNGNHLLIGITKEPDTLKKLISKRVDERIKQGMVNEVRRLKKDKVSSKRLEKIGLTYAIIDKFIQGQITKQEMVEQIKTAEYQYSKRQMTWFKKDDRIHWVRNSKEAAKLIQKLLQQT